MSGPEWLALFRPGLDPLELVVRGTAVYWFLFLLFREQGVDKLADVKIARVEADGDISVIRARASAAEDA